MITINETKEIITFIENGNEIKNIKRTSRNAQYCFVKKMGIDSFDWDCNEYAKRLKVCAEKYINSFNKENKPKANDVENYVNSEVGTPITKESEVKAVSDNKPLEEVKGAGNVEAVSKSRVFTTDDGDTITVVA